MTATKQQWRPAEVLTTQFDAQVAAHDYRHMGWYARVKHEGERRWLVVVAWGRVKQMRCCFIRHRNGVKEADYGATWTPRKNPVLSYRRRRDDDVIELPRLPKPQSVPQQLKTFIRNQVATR